MEREVINENVKSGVDSEKARGRKGDTVVFDSIIRMGRNMNEAMSKHDWFVKKLSTAAFC